MLSSVFVGGVFWVYIVVFWLFGLGYFDDVYDFMGVDDV